MSLKCRLTSLSALLTFVILDCSNTLHAQPLAPDPKPAPFDVPQLPTNQKTDAASVDPRDDKGSEKNEKTDYVAIWKVTARNLGIALLCFAIVLFAGQFIVIYKSKAEWTDNSFKAFGLSLILVTSMFLMLIGYDDKQLAPMIGLLGTLAGYILGTHTKQ
jgi:hypothetical protein